MTLFQYTVIAFALFNFTAFIVAGKSFFVASHARAPSYIFMGSFLVLFVLTMMGLVFGIHHSWAPLGFSFVALAVSLVIFFSATYATKKQPFTVIFSPDKPQHLNTSGIYYYIRHPFYSSYIVNFFACSIASSSPLPWTCMTIVLLTYTLAAKMEEKKFAVSDFGPGYAAYKKHAGLFFPKIGARMS